MNEGTSSTRTNRSALVLGATGGVGGAIAETLALRGWQVRGLARDQIAANAAWRKRAADIRWIEGDAMSFNDVTHAAKGADVIVHAVNPPGYRNWDRLVLPMLDNTLAAAASNGARIVLPGTIYNYDPTSHPLVDEKTPQQPNSRKGAIRVEMERRLKEASQTSPVLIVRAGDFFGPNCRSSWFHQAMVTPGKPVRRLVHPGKNVGHTWAYLPDLARAVALLLDIPEKLKPFECLQLEGVWDPDGKMIPDAVRKIVGHDLSEWRFPWWLLKALSPFFEFPREASEIRPFWQHPVRLCNTRLVSLLGFEPRTCLEDALAATLSAKGCWSPKTTKSPKTNQSPEPAL